MLFKQGSGYGVNCAGQGCSMSERCQRFVVRKPGGLWASYDLEHALFDTQDQEPCPNFVPLAVKGSN